jgi:hypothetical protein
LSRAVGQHTKAVLERIDHPPTDEQMCDVMHALAWDGNMERLAELADRMMEHHRNRPECEQRDRSIEGEMFRERHRNSWRYWLGVRGVALSTCNSRRHRREARGSRSRTRRAA